MKYILKIRNKINSYSIRGKIILMMLLPVCGVILMSGWKINEKYIDYKTAKYINELVHFSVTLEDVIENIAIERGLTEGFVCSGGKRFAAELARQRVNTDNVLVEFDFVTNDVLKKIYINNDASISLKMTNKLSELVNKTLDIARVRRDVDRLIDNNSFAYYSNLNAMAIDFMTLLKFSLNDVSIARKFNQFNLLLRLKELGGQVRGMVNGELSTGGLTPETRVQVEHLIKSQERIEEYLNLVAPPYLNTKMHLLQQSPKFEQFIKFRLLVLNGNKSITPDEWFNKATERIDGLAKVTKTVLSEIKIVAKNSSNKAFNTLAAICVFLMLCALFSFVIAWALGSYINRSAALIAEQICDFGRKGAGDEKKYISGDDELANVLSAFNKMRDVLHDNHLKLLQSEKMSTLGQMSAGIAHEINTPLGYIKSNLGVLPDCIDAIDELILLPGDHKKEIDFEISEIKEIGADCL